MFKKVFAVFLMIFISYFILSAEPVSFAAPIAGEFISRDESDVIFVNIESGDNLLVFYLPDELSSISVKIEDSYSSTLYEGEVTGQTGAYFPESGFYKVTITPVDNPGRWSCAIINKTEYEAAGYGFTDGGE